MRKAVTSPALASAAHSAVGRRKRTTIGLVTAATTGIRSTQEECAPPAFISGTRRNASGVAGGRRIQISMHSEKTTIRRNLLSTESAKQC